MSTTVNIFQHFSIFHCFFNTKQRIQLIFNTMLMCKLLKMNDVEKITPVEHVDTKYMGLTKQN